MFKITLSAALRQICTERELTFEAASLKCGLNSRFLEELITTRADTSIDSLEKLCNGLGVTPNELLLGSHAFDELTYRSPLAVTRIRVYQGRWGLDGYPLCPRCGITMEREYQRYCDRCGQYLDWSNYDEAQIVTRPVRS